MLKNTASQVIGAQMVNASTGAAFTGSVTVYVTGDAGTQAVGSVGSGACTHEGNGYHTYAPAQAETNYDLVAFTFIGTGAVPATVQVFTISFNPHDTVRLGLTALPNAAADAAGGLPISDAGGLDLDGLNTNVSSILTDTGTTLPGVLGTPSDLGSGATLAGNMVDIENDTAEIGPGGAGLTEAGGTGDQLTAVAWNAAWDAEVQSEANDALVALGLDHLVSASVSGTDVADDSIIAQMVSKSATADWDSFDNTSEALEALRDRGDAAWTTGAGGSPPDILQTTTIATLASQTSFTLTAGSADDDAYNGALAIITDQSTSTQKAVGTVSDYTGASKTITLDSDPGIFTMAVGDSISLMAVPAGSGLTAGAVADAVLDEAVSGHTTAGTVGKYISDILTDTAEIGAAGAGLTEAGGDGDHLSAQPWNAAWDAEVQSEVTDALNAYDPPTKTEMDAGFAGLNDPTAAAIRAEIDSNSTQLAAILTDTGTTLPATLATIAAYIDTEVAAIKAVTDVIPDSGAMTSIAQASALATLDSVADAIKAVTDQMVFTETNLLDVNALAISGSTDAADYLEEGAESVLQVVIGTGSTTTTLKFSTVNGGAPSADDDFYNGSYFVFRTGALAGQRVQINDYTGATTTATISAATGSASNGDTGIIV